VAELHKFAYFETSLVTSITSSSTIRWFSDENGYM